MALSNILYSQDKDLSVSGPSHESILVSPHSSPSTHLYNPPAAQFDPLSYPVLSELCSIWFKRYHPWFPILHQPSLTASLQNLENSPSSQLLAVKAICAVTLTHYESPLVSAEERRQWSDSLRDTVYCQAMQQMSLQSVQALLIVSNLEYGEGRFEQFWNLLALCKRYVSLPYPLRIEVFTSTSISAQLGYGTLIKHQVDHINSSTSVPPRLHPVSTTILDREERIRAYWMTEMLDSMSTVGVEWETGASPPTSNGILPCSDSLWAFPEHIIDIWSFGKFRYSSAFSLCIILATNELWFVHGFLQKPWDLNDTHDRIQWQTEAQKIDERLTAWREEFVAAVYRLINAEYAEEERAEMDPNIVLTNCVLDV